MSKTLPFSSIPQPTKNLKKPWELPALSPLDVNGGMPRDPWESTVGLVFPS
ncbi:hypothetical protein V7S76_03765 [Aquirufa sp. ROCK2-A2]